MRRPQWSTNTRVLMLLRRLLNGEAIAVYGSHSRLAMDSDRQVSYFFQRGKKLYFNDHKLSMGDFYKLCENLPEAVFRKSRKGR